MVEETASDQVDARREWMSLLAKAPGEELARRWADAGFAEEFAGGAAGAFEWLRAPECGAVMVRGRTGGVGKAFNLGEMTVTRCALRLGSGEVGHGYVQGRDKTKARLAALCDALMQTGRAEEVEAQVLLPLRRQMAEARQARASRAAATKVDFFTLVRGED